MRNQSGNVLLFIIVMVLAISALILAIGKASEMSANVVKVKTEYSEIMPTEYCVNICIKDIFSNMHNSSNGIGTGNSSMNGMGQQNTFIEVKNYCESIYKETCVSLDYDSRRKSIHDADLRFITNQIGVQ